MGNKFLYIFLGGFAFGVFLRSFSNFGSSFPVFLFLLAVILYIFWKISEGEVFLPISIFILAAGLGIFRFNLSNSEVYRLALSRYVGETVTIQGVVSEELDKRETHNFLTLDAKEVSLMGGQNEKVSTRILLAADKYPEFNYGDELKISGLVKKPENFDDGGLREFDYVSFLSKDGIYYVMYRPKIELVSHGKGNFLKTSLFKVKNAFVGNVSKVVPEPESSLLAGLVVGAKQSLGKEWLDRFRKVGIIHIVVLSGYNVTIVADFVAKVFSFLPKFFPTVIGAISIALFAIMTGASATVVRATIMALIVILARAASRTYLITRALLLAGFLMILQNPKILVFDSSFQLSFLSTLALIYVSPIVEPRLKFITEKWKIREVATATVATQIFVLPFLLYKMGEFSIVSLPVNLLVLFFIPITMFFGFVTGLVGFVSALLSIPFAWFSYFLLAYELKVVELFSSLSFITIKVSYFPFWLTLISYILLAFFIFRLRRRKLK